MIIEIDDKLSPKERKRKLKAIPLLYALKKHNGVQYKAAEWLGITVKTLRSQVKKHVDVKPQRKLTEYEEMELEEFKQNLMKSMGYRYAENKQQFLSTHMALKKKQLLKQ